MFDRSIRCQTFVDVSVEAFDSRCSFLAHELVDRFAGGGASEAGAWTDQKAGSALLRSASEGLNPWRAMPSSWPCRRTSKNATQTLLDAPNFSCCNSNSVRSATVAIRSRAL